MCYHNAQVDALNIHEIDARVAGRVISKKMGLYLSRYGFVFLYLYLRLYLYLYQRDAQMAGRVISKISGLDFSISGNCIVYNSVYSQFLETV